MKPNFRQQITFRKKICYVAGTALSVTLAPLALLMGQILTSSYSAFAAEPTESSVPTINSLPIPAPSTGNATGLEATVPPSTTEPPSSEPSAPGTPSPEPSPPEASSPVPSAPVSEPTSNPVPSANPEPAPEPSESSSAVPQPPEELPAPDITNGAAGLPALPSVAPTSQPSAGVDQIDGSGATSPGQVTAFPSTLGNSVAGAQPPGHIDAVTSQLGTPYVDGTVLGIFSSSQQGYGYTGGPEWMEGFLNVSGAQSGATSSADPNQAAGVSGAEAQGHQVGAVAGSSVFQRGGTIMNGARPLLIFTGIATAGLALVIFNFVWRNRAPRN